MWAGLISNPVFQMIVGWIGKKIWGLLTDKYKDHLANEQIDKNVRSVLDKYEALVLKYDELLDSGKLTEGMKDEIRKDKIKLEEDLINHIQR